MKTKEQIIEHINELDKKFALVLKHHNKYIDLYFKAKNSWSFRDFTGSRMRKYRHKCKKCFILCSAITNYKEGLEWVLDNKHEVNNDKIIMLHRFTPMGI